MINSLTTGACLGFRAAHPAPVEAWSVEEIEGYLDASLADQAFFAGQGVVPAWAWACPRCGCINADSDLSCGFC